MSVYIYTHTLIYKGVCVHIGAHIIYAYRCIYNAKILRLHRIRGKQASLQGWTAFEQFLQCIRHQHQTCMLFVSPLLFLSKEVYCEKCEEKSLSPPSFLLFLEQWSCSAVLFHNHNCVFSCASESVLCLVTFLDHLPRNFLLTIDFHHLIVVLSHGLEISTSMSSTECQEAAF